MIASLIDEGWVGQLTLSQDTVGDLPARPLLAESAFAPRRPARLFTEFVPLLRAHRVSDASIETLLVENPARLLPF